MSTKNLPDFLDELEDEQNPGINTGRRRSERLSRQRKNINKETRDFVRKQDDSRSNFEFTYKAARFEEWWLLDSLGDFYEHKWISDVLSRVKGGKEASVYLCQSDASDDAKLVAAKVYRPRSLRNLKNDGQYRVGRADLDESGRVILDDRALRAMKKRTAFGEELRHQSWIAYEFQTLQTLHCAGASVPRPYAMEKNAILMDFVGDRENPAPPLNTISMRGEEAKSVFASVLHNIDLMLAQGCVHGDLSAFNILYWDGGITLIDFPQVVLIGPNPAAWMIFQRDIPESVNTLPPKALSAITGSSRLICGLHMVTRCIEISTPATWTLTGLRIGFCGKSRKTLDKKDRRPKTGRRSFFETL